MICITTKIYPHGPWATPHPSKKFHQQANATSRRQIFEIFLQKVQDLKGKDFPTWETCQSLDKFRYLNILRCFALYVEENVNNNCDFFLRFFTDEIFHSTQIIMTLFIPDKAKLNTKSPLKLCYPDLLKNAGIF